jgi:8-oxo-dGTP pyrophosphatase MutT (NUDIX family)
MGAPVTVVPTVNVTAPTSAATIVIRDGLVLTGRRRDNGLICGPGGHIEQNETPEKAARREAQEEFGICLGDIVQIGTMTGLPEQYGVPVIFVCSDYTGVPVTDGKEMEQPEFVDPSQIAEEDVSSVLRKPEAPAVAAFDF